MSFRVHFQDVPPSERIRAECEELASHLGSEFPETDKFEVTIRRSGENFATHLHVTGKQVSVNSSAESRGMRETLQEAFERAHRQLRKHHDKVIFTRRREAQKSGRRS